MSSNARDAALKILLGDVEPLLNQVEKIAQDLQNQTDKIQELHGQVGEALDEKASEIKKLLAAMDVNKNLLIGEIAIKAKEQAEKKLEYQHKNQSVLFAALFFCGGAAVGILLTLAYRFI